MESQAVVNRDSAGANGGSDATPSPGPAVRRDIVELVGKVAFPDPYRHLEDQTRVVLDWERQVDEATRRRLAELPHREVLEHAVAEEFRSRSISLPMEAEGRWFTLDRRDLDSSDAVFVSRTPADLGELLLTAADVGEPDRSAIEWIAPAPSGQLLALGVSNYGDQQTTLMIVDADTGRTKGPSIPLAWACQWLPDSTGLYCSAGRTRAAEGVVRDILFVRLRGGPSGVPLPGDIQDSIVVPALSSDGRFLSVSTSGVTPRLLYVLVRSSGEWWRAQVEPSPELFSGVFLGDTYFAVTTHGAPKGRLVAATLDALAVPQRWQEVVPESNAVMRAVGPVGRDLVLVEYVQGRSRLRLLDLAERELSTIPVPAAGLVTRTGRDVQHMGADPLVSVDSGGILFRHETVGGGARLLRYEPSSNTTTTVRGGHDRSALREWSGSCGADDGWTVPYDAVERGGPSNVRLPTLLVAYGGLNAIPPFTVGYLAMLAPFAHAGGRIVFAHVRGDGTYGADQWRAARGPTKRRTFTDLVTVAEHLIERDLCTSSILGLLGGSNGGLTVGAALTSRPDLFRAVVALAPLFDLCRAINEPPMDVLIPEYGDPRLEREAAVVRDCSPYHAVVDGMSYPATLIICGGRDTAVASWHGRKMFAALRDANAGPHEVMLRIHANYGHETAVQYAPPWIIAEWLAFLMDQLGLRFAGGSPRTEAAIRRPASPGLA
jgi:prolyl oligopeptidase